MNRTQALSKLCKLYGPKAGIQTYKGAPRDAEAMRAARKARAEADAALKEARAAHEARRAAVLAADPEYQRLLAESAARSKARDALPSGHSYPYTVGYSSSLFFHVTAQGYTLREAVELAEEAKRTGKQGTASPKEDAQA